MCVCFEKLFSFFAQRAALHYMHLRCMHAASAAAEYMMIVGVFDTIFLFYFLSLIPPPYQRFYIHRSEKVLFRRWTRFPFPR